MEQHKEDDPKQEPEDHHTPPSSTKGKNADNEKDPKSKSECTCTSPKKPLHVSAKDHWTIGNWIAIVAVVISGLLFLFTYRLFNQNADQFSVVNRPNLAIGNIEIPKRIVGKEFIIGFSIYNLGAYPLHIYGSKHFFKFDTASAINAISTISEMKTDGRVGYLVLQYPYRVQWTLTDSLTKKDSTNLQEGNTTFCQEFEYYNEMAKCWRTFICIMSLKIGPPDRISRTYYVENRDTNRILYYRPPE
jgi:hypothetical protein